MASAARIKRDDELIYDWNKVARSGRVFPEHIEILDETLRDGLQNPSVVHPKVDDKLRILGEAAKMGIQCVTIGMPGSSKRAFDDCLAVCKQVAASKLPIGLACAGRTVESDIAPIIELSQRAGISIAVCAFVGSSPIRALAERWDLELLKGYTAAAIDLGVNAGLPVTFVTEDTTRSRPEVLAELFSLAIDHGAARLCLCDTVGHATPDGVRALVEFTRSHVAGMGADIGIDWHGHNDRGLALINAMHALEAGADRVHATALGIGERVGNTPMELLLLNLRLHDQLAEFDLTHLPTYCRAVAEALGWPIPINYPLIGRDAFRTATGVHAAAIAKAQTKGAAYLADRVYSGVPAGLIGRAQEILIGYMSGSSNVVHWLRSHGIEPSEELVRAILAKAKSSDRILSDEDIMNAVRAHAARP